MASHNISNLHIRSVEPFGEFATLAGSLQWVPGDSSVRWSMGNLSTFEQKPPSSGGGGSSRPVGGFIYPRRLC